MSTVTTDTTEGNMTVDKSLEEIGAMLGHLSNRLVDTTKGCADEDMDFVVRKLAIALTNINLNLQTLADCHKTGTPVGGIRLSAVKVESSY